MAMAEFPRPRSYDLDGLGTCDQCCYATCTCLCHGTLTDIDTWHCADPREAESYQGYLGEYGDAL